MSQILSYEKWFTISDVVHRDDGQIMSFKINSQEHGLITVEANVPWKEWEMFMHLAGRSAGGAGIGAAFGPLGALAGAAAGVISFFKSYDDKSPGYVHRASGTHYFDRFFSIRDASTYRT